MCRRMVDHLLFSGRRKLSVEFSSFLQFLSPSLMRCSTKVPRFSLSRSLSISLKSFESKGSLMYLSWGWLKC